MPQPVAATEVQPTPSLTPKKDQESEICASIPPTKFLHNTWFTKYCDAKGIPILSSENVADSAVQQAHDVVTMLLSLVPDYRDVLVRDEIKVVIYDTEEEDLSEVPGYCISKTSDLYGKYCDSTRTVITWENDLFRNKGCSQYTIHEFAHALEVRIMRIYDSTLDNELKRAYDSAKEQGLWPGYYAMKSQSEYWATSVMAYFNVGWDDDVEEEIKRTEVPVDMITLIEKIFEESTWTPICPIRAN